MRFAAAATLRANTVGNGMHVISTRVSVEFNPVVQAFQKVTVRKWREHPARGAENGDAGA